MKKKKGFIRLTHRGIAYFAIFWAVVYFAVFGFPESNSENSAAMNVEGSLTIHFIDVGQADAAVILCGGQVMMIDGGNSEDSSLIYSYLQNTLGIRHIDYMIATHPHEDHIGGLSGALNACTVGMVYSPVLEYESRVFDSLVRYAEQQGKKLTVPSIGDTFMLGGASVQFVSPRRQYGDINDMSIVVRIVFGNTSFLFTGDAEGDAEHDMVDSKYDLSATLLKVGHHGSSSSSSYVFLREVMPQYAVISVGEGNSYGHPTEEALSRLRDVGAAVYRTDLNGHIVVTSDGRELSFSPQKGNVSDKDAIYGTVGWNRPLSFEDVIEEMEQGAQSFFSGLWEKFVSFIKRSIAW